MAHELETGALKEIRTNPELPARAIGLALPKDEELSFAVKEFLNLIRAG